MILSAKSGLRGMFVREDNGEPVRWVRWYDTETSEYEAFSADPVHARANGRNLHALLYRGQARLRFVPARIVSTPGPKPPDPKDVAECVAEQRSRHHKARRIVALPGRECQEKGCHRLAEWEVADAADVLPDVQDGRQFHRSIVLGLRRYCSWHYRPPLVMDLRGDMAEVEVSARPQ
jgi:hypothetical protein